MRVRFVIALIVLALFAFAHQASATVTTFTNAANWQAAAGPYSTITFTELPAGTWITEQYAPLGVHFTDGSDQVYATNSFITDGVGLSGAFDETTLVFDAPMTTIAMDFPGLVAIKLYSSGNLIYNSPAFGGSGVGHFIGLTSTQSFDKAFLYDPSTDLFVDNLYFGPPVPGPTGLAVLALGGLLPLRCRRRCADGSA